MDDHVAFDDSVLFKRQSPLTVGEPGPDGAALATMLRSAMCAPDHGKMRPWRFLVISSDARYAFGDLLGDALRRRQADAAEDVLARERSKALRAPVILVVIAKVVERKLVPAVEQIIAAGIAANNILLTACALGYGGMWRTGAAAYDEHVRRALGIESPDSIVGFLYLGTPATMPPPREIPAVDSYVRYWRGMGSIGSSAASEEATPGTGV